MTRSEYDTICFGFPIWCYVAPMIINTSLEIYDLSGKKIVLFATADSNGFGNMAAESNPFAPSTGVIDTDVLTRIFTESKVKKLIELIQMSL